MQRRAGELSIRAVQPREAPGRAVEHITLRSLVAPAFQGLIHEGHTEPAASSLVERPMELEPTTFSLGS